MQTPGPPTSDAPGSPAGIPGALGLAVDELVALLPEQPVRAPVTPAWGANAAIDTGAYRRWRRAEQARTSTVSVPADGPTISVLVPVYRPALWYFRSCVESVLAQHYGAWELCLCDDASDDAELRAYLEELPRRDPRVKVTALERNGGISLATNAALGLAGGELVALLDHDDELTPDALAEVAAAALAHPDLDVCYSDDDKIAENTPPFLPHFKPDWSPDLLLSYPYLSHLLVVRRALLEEIGGFRPDFDGSQDYDVMLRATERARRVVHIPKVLYHWRIVSGSAAGDTAAKPWAHRASRRALEDAVRRRGVDARVDDGPFPGAYHVRRRVQGRPKVSVIVPLRDQAAMTIRCLESLEAEDGHEELDVVLVDNGSVEPETRALFARLGDQARVIEHDAAFNWSVINNVAAATCDSDLLLFVNNDVETSKPGWLTALAELAQRPDVGAVGARLVFPGGVVQHAGVVLGQYGIAGHVFMGLPSEEPSYFSWDQVIRPYSAVTGACMMTRRAVFDELGGFDEELEVAFNDIDYCLRVVDAGLQVLYTPHAELVHHESVSRGMAGFLRDCAVFLGKWGRDRLRRDPYYNPNLSLFAHWCPVRGPAEEEQWEALMDELEGAVSGTEPA